MNANEVVIASARRTPMGAFQGSLSSQSAVALGIDAVRAAVSDAGIDPQAVGEILMGCVLPAGLKQAPARQVGRGAGLGEHCGAVTLNKVCGSGMKTLMQAHDSLKAGSQQWIVAGGMESMTGAPYLLPQARSGLRMGHDRVYDTMFLDGLEDAYTGRAMGSFAQDTADAHQLTREAMDAYAIRSLERARAAQSAGAFSDEIVPVAFETRAGTQTVTEDEQPLKGKPEKIPSLKPAFKSDGTITAANSSSISDGAAALVLTTAGAAADAGVSPLARIVAHASHAQAPETFTTAPLGAIAKVAERAGWDLASVDLFEINEA
ncbi:MAG: acetyl-CoA C-acyltransferase, partial [Proteobacteria bacterium]|nr:acetyl-CoA C-acyltransferase [Pseudomonadota bacterium]